MIFEPFYDRVAMEFINEEKTEAGLFIPKNVQEKEAMKCRVVAVGKGKFDAATNQHVPTQVKEGDVVYVNPYLGVRVKINRNTQILVQKEEEVLGRVPPEASGG